MAEHKLGHRAEGGAEVIMAPEELDHYTVPEFRDLVAGLIREGRYKLVVSLERTEFVDPEGQVALMDVWRSTRAAGGWLSVACTHEPTLRMLRTFLLADLFDVHETVEDALAAHGIGGKADLRW